MMRRGATVRIELDVRWLYLAALLAVAAVLPLFAPEYLVGQLTKGYILGIAAVGLNILYYYTGLVSFGHAMFMATGAYTVGILTVKQGWGLGPAVAAAFLATLVAGLFVGYVSLRHIRIYFALLTLAFGQLLYTFLVKFTEITGGSDGLIGIPRPQAFNTTTSFYYLTLIVAAATLYLAWRIVNSPLGLAFRAVRDNAERARLLGINVERVRLASFVVSAMVTGVAGVLWAMYERVITPEMAYWTESAQLVFATLLGGPSWFLGPFIGGIVLNAIISNLVLRFEYWLFVLGAVLVALTLFLPEGLASLPRVLRRGGVARSGG